MTWQEVRAAIQSQAPVIVPIGTIETQGPSTFVGFESVLAQRLARAAAERTTALVLPVVPFGYSPHFEGVPGTISLRPEVLSGIYEDILRSLVDQGCTRILVMAMHLPNREVLEQVAYKIRRERGVLAAWMNPGQLAGVMLRRVAPNHPAAPAHGADPGLSLALYLEPAAIRGPDRPTQPASPEFQGLPLTGMMPSFQGVPLGMPLKIFDVSPQDAGLGDTSYANAELGKAIFEKMVEHVVAAVNQLATMNMRAEG